MVNINNELRENGLLGAIPGGLHGGMSSTSSSASSSYSHFYVGSMYDYLCLHVARWYT